ncbi:MAG: aminotransferase class V-fold PLP-dependent enzyme [Alphaproteobacteria bacterium]|nr:aminotransferase class V-fold PLP-dependent enzyme [Alphaproteobacteria bacterium]
MSIDVAQIRADTPGCEARLHFNNAGASLPPDPVLDTVIAHLRREAEIGGYEAAAEANSRLEHFYQAAARLVGGKAEEIAFIENATRAWDMAFYAIDWHAGDQILTAQAEYASNYIAYLHVAQRHGVEVQTVPNDSHGQISVEALEKQINERTKLIAITHIPTNGGLVNPAAAVGKVAKAHGVPFLLDACQAVGQIPIDVDAIGCDMLSATGRKYLRGPRGTGFLWVRESMIGELDPPLLDLHAARWTGPDSYEVRGDARRFENWESFVAGRLGLAQAIDYALDLGMENIRDRIYALATQLRDGLDSLPGATVRDLGRERCGIVTFTVEGHDPQAIKETLAAQSINVSASRRASTLLDMTERNLDVVVRASVHYYNREDEVDRLIEAVKAL